MAAVCRLRHKPIRILRLLPRTILSLQTDALALRWHYLVKVPDLDADAILVILRTLHEIAALRLLLLNLTVQVEIHFSICLLDLLQPVDGDHLRVLQ